MARLFVTLTSQRMKSCSVTIQMKPLQQYFHMVLFIYYVVLTLSLWMKSYGVTIQMKPLQQYFDMVLFISYVVLTFESVDEILWCDHSNETSLAQLLHSTIYIFRN